jgi:hypothetical protein
VFQGRCQIAQQNEFTELLIVIGSRSGITRMRSQIFQDAGHAVDRFIWPLCQQEPRRGKYRRCLAADWRYSLISHGSPPVPQGLYRAD